jgi:hypothetical protein
MIQGMIWILEGDGMVIFIEKALLLMIILRLTLGSIGLTAAMLMF